MDTDAKAVFDNVQGLSDSDVSHVYESLAESEGGSLGQCLRPKAMGSVGDEVQFLGPWHTNEEKRAIWQAAGRVFPIRCGTCINCKLNASRELVIRCEAELRLTPGASWMITLTYDNEHLPLDGSLDHSHFQKFIRRVRKKLGKVRFLLAAEYGSRHGRPHFHLLAFGLTLTDHVKIDDRNYRSPMLRKLWGMGEIHIGQCTPASIRYCAGYVTKKSERDFDRPDLATDSKAALASHEEAHRLRADGGFYQVGKTRKPRIQIRQRMGDTVLGTLYVNRWVRPEYGLASNHPGLGAAYADRHSDYTLKTGQFVRSDGKTSFLIPRYFLRRWAETDPEEYAKFAALRQDLADSLPEPLSREGLKALGKNVRQARRDAARRSKPEVL